MLKKLSKTLLAAGAALALTAAAASAETQLRIQTHFSPETLSGKMAAEFVQDITAMKNVIQIVSDINTQFFPMVRDER